VHTMKVHMGVEV